MLAAKVEKTPDKTCPLIIIGTIKNNKADIQIPP